MPEPVVVIGGAIALLMMLSGKKKKGAPKVDEEGNVPGGGSDSKTPVGDPDAGVKGGGTKRPGGGYDQSDYVPPTNLGDNDLWIAPDCRGVIQGPGFWANKFRPRVLQIARSWNRDWAPGVNDVMAVALGQFIFTGTPEPLFPPGSLPSCLSDWPGWWWGTVYSRTSTQAQLDRYESDIDAYNAAFPALGSYLESLKKRMLDDPAILAAILDTQEYPPNVLYFTGVDSSLTTPAGQYIMQIAGPRLHEMVDYDRLTRIYPESFPKGEALMVFMRPAGSMGFQRAIVPWEWREGGPMTFALNSEEERMNFAQQAVDTVVNEVGWYPPSPDQES